MQMALSGLSTAERTQRVSDFVAWRAHFITATPATFFSLEQASSREVYRTLEEQVKGLAADWANPTQVHEKLKALTQMPDLTGELGRLYASQQLQKLRELKAETARQMQALGGDAGSEGMTVAQVDQLSMQLERKLCKPANIDKYLHAVQEHQGEGRRNQQVAATVKGVSDLLLADLQPWKGRLVAEYRDERLTVGAADPLLG